MRYLIAILILLLALSAVYAQDRSDEANACGTPWGDRILGPCLTDAQWRAGWFLAYALDPARVGDFIVVVLDGETTGAIWYNTGGVVLHADHRRSDGVANAILAHANR